MSSGLQVLDRNIDVTNEWLNEVAEITGGSKQQAYHVLRRGLHVVRDRVTVEEAAHLAAQLPHFVRGIFYEGYRPAATPTKERSLAQFLDTLAEDLPDGIEPHVAANALFKALKLHCDPGELAHVRDALPGPVAEVMDAA
ncbi:MAG: DUF2267 domain-containing protein [Paracoccaceae bacterium]|jgi:uncharacterized protein (DUF2267 family)|nr:DUF2267 domain-containing protein [Paracoccaceae bacterium]